MPAKAQLIGQKFGKLTVHTKYPPTKHWGQSIWGCKCDCGNLNEIKVETSSLTTGNTQSCGCIRNEKSSERATKRNFASRQFHPSISTARSIFRELYNDSNLLFEQFLELSQKHCIYCDASPSNKQRHIAPRSSQYFKDHCEFVYNGLDRINSSLPHNIDNVITCCIICNQAKCDQSIEQFLTQITNIHNLSLSGRHKPLIPETEIIIQDAINNGFKYIKNGKLKHTTIGNKYFHRVLDHYRDRDFDWTICYYLCNQNCYWCGAPPRNKVLHETATSLYNGLDRLICKDENGNKLGHTLDNVVPCDICCNFAKNDMSPEEFLAWTEKVYERIPIVMKLLNN